MDPDKNPFKAGDFARLVSYDSPKYGPGYKSYKSRLTLGNAYEVKAVGESSAGRLFPDMIIITDDHGEKCSTCWDRFQKAELQLATQIKTRDAVVFLKSVVKDLKEELAKANKRIAELEVASNGTT